MKRSRFIAVLAAIILCALPSFADEAPVKHIRVILDTSISLHRTDPNGYVKTATALLYDLSWQLLRPKDTFTVVPFDPGWPEVQEPPESVGPLIVPGHSDDERARFVQQMLGTAYESRQTYFSPGIYWSYRDLEKAGSKSDQKVIVLVTDGVPDEQTIDFDGPKLKRLVPKLRETHIKLYILAFGDSVDQPLKKKQEWFNNIFQFNQPDGVEGKFFPGRDASNLLDNMLDIFAKSFGYFKQNFGTQTKIDITGGVARDNAVVVSIYKPGAEPGFQLTTPDGKPVGDVGMYKVHGREDPLGKPKGSPVSYAFQWLRKPDTGTFGLTSAAAPLQVAVLWPNGFNINLRKLGNNPIDAVMAGRSAPMEVVVTPSSGAGEDPGKITVSFHLYYLKTNDDGTFTDASEHPPAVPKEGVYVKGVGRVFRIEPQFQKDPPPQQPGTVYQGYIGVRVTPLGSTTVLVQKDDKYPVQVYPYVSLQPTPPEVTIKAGSRELLRGGDFACSAEFKFQLQGESNHLNDSNYRLGVRLSPPLELTGGWRGAKFRFDTQEMNAASSAKWQAETPFDPTEIATKKHKLCVQLGTPRNADLERLLTVQFGVWPAADERYQDLNVVQGLSARASIEAPDFWQIWRPWLLLLITLLLLGLTYLYWKYRQLLPPDLALSLADGTGHLTPARLGPGPFGSRWLGLPNDRPVISPGGDKELGSVRPLDEDLFVFRPAKGYGFVMVEVDSEWQPVAARGDGSWLLEAGKKYRVGAQQDIRFFRLDYTETRPKV